MNNLHIAAVEPFGSSYGQKKMSSQCLVRAKGRSMIYSLFKFQLQSTAKIDPALIFFHFAAIYF